MKTKVKTIFVILVYRNTEVLSDFYKSFHFEDSKTIVVNSYYDDDSMKEVENISKKYDADFISIANKGYGYGNNVGIKYAIEHYDFDFLIISNSDIIIRNMDYLNNLDDRAAVYAPCIKMKNGKNQNPNIPWYISFYFRLFEKWFKTGKRADIKKAYFVARASRELLLFWTKISRKPFYKIFSPHGSFIIFSKKAVEMLNPVFNEKMCLYFEEYYLGLRCRLLQLPILYCPKIDILHLEGASSSNVPSKYARGSAEVLLNWMHENRLL